MRALLLTIGSRGDVEPFCAIAKELLLRQHQVVLFLEPNWRFLAEPLVEEFGASSILILDLPFTNASFFPNGASLESLMDIQLNYILPCYGTVLEEAKQECHCLVANSMATYLLTLVAKETHLPTVLVHLQPLLPNQVFPSYRLSPTKFCQAIQEYYTRKERGEPPHYQPDFMFEVNPNLYQGLLKDNAIARACRHCEIERGATNANRNSINIPEVLPFSWDELQPILAGCHPQFTIANAYSNHLIPIMEGTPGIGPFVQDVGPLADDYIAALSTTNHNDNAPTELPPLVQSFLSEPTTTAESKSVKPIAIGFGSMPVKEMDAVWEALQSLPSHQKVILIGKTLTPTNTNTNNNPQWLHVTSIPYPLLLPHCSMMICHGGAGVLQACLRAGIPSLVCPVMGDQFALAAVVHMLQYGRQACRRFAELKSQDLIRGIQYLQSESDAATYIYDNCQRVAKEIRHQNKSGSDMVTGSKKLVNIMEQKVCGALLTEAISICRMDNIAP